MNILRASIASTILAATLAVPALAQDAFADAEQFYAAFATALNGDDVAAIQALYAEGVVFVPSPGVALTKVEDITGALGQFAAMSDQFDVKLRSVYENGETLLAIADWTLVGKAQDGAPITLSGSTADVLRRSADGTLLAVIDNPFGSALPQQ
jgi:ketosteroid isomerase-like protein